MCFNMNVTPQQFHGMLYFSDVSQGLNDLLLLSIIIFKNNMDMIVKVMSAFSINIQLEEIDISNNRENCRKLLVFGDGPDVPNISINEKSEANLGVSVGKE